MVSYACTQGVKSRHLIPRGTSPTKSDGDSVPGGSLLFGMIIRWGTPTGKHTHGLTKDTIFCSVLISLTQQKGYLVNQSLPYQGRWPSDSKVGGVRPSVSFADSSPQGQCHQLKRTAILRRGRCPHRPAGNAAFCARLRRIRLRARADVGIGPYGSALS